MTAQEDHKRMMELLGIKAIRRGPSGNPKAPNAANLDESKAKPYPDLPDPLVLQERQEGHDRRSSGRSAAPEIVEDFDREVYGRVPEGARRR